MYIRGCEQEPRYEQFSIIWDSALACGYIHEEIVCLHTPVKRVYRYALSAYLSGKFLPGTLCEGLLPGLEHCMSRNY